MDDVAAAILLKIAVDHNELLKAKIKQVNPTSDPQGFEKVLVPWWRSFKSQNP
jgi:hypothetical protein